MEEKIHWLLLCEFLNGVIFANIFFSQGLVRFFFQLFCLCMNLMEPIVNLYCELKLVTKKN